MIVEKYLQLRYNESKWPYHGVNKLIYDLRDKLTKDQVRNEIRELMKNGQIDIVGGINGYLIKINENKWFE